MASALITLQKISEAVASRRSGEYAFILAPTSCCPTGRAQRGTALTRRRHAGLKNNVQHVSIFRSTCCIEKSCGPSPSGNHESSKQDKISLFTEPARRPQALADLQDGDQPDAPSSPMPGTRHRICQLRDWSFDEEEEFHALFVL